VIVPVGLKPPDNVAVSETELPIAEVPEACVPIEVTALVTVVFALPVDVPTTESLVAVPVAAVICAVCSPAVVVTESKVGAFRTLKVKSMMPSLSPDHQPTA
jgi:hypothetical protein